LITTSTAIPIRGHGAVASLVKTCDRRLTLGRSRNRLFRGRTVAGAVLAAALTAGSIALVPSADAATNPFERGPAPTTASIEATRGSFAVSQTTVSSVSVSGFGGARVHRP
jgi:hypothetical protein